MQLFAVAPSRLHVKVAPTSPLIESDTVVRLLIALIPLSSGAAGAIVSTLHVLVVGSLVSPLVSVRVTLSVC
ncbi:MAG: hypothetical protein KGN78_15005, partial [Actinomycetales bacterium]|nr:hypothetical protein [Actinomycetales bacterium]